MPFPACRTLCIIYLAPKLPWAKFSKGQVIRANIVQLVMQQMLHCKLRVFIACITTFFTFLLRRGLLQSRWVETRRGCPFPSSHRSLRSHFPAPVFFFHWYLLTGASVAERASSRNKFPCCRKQISLLVFQHENLTSAEVVLFMQQTTSTCKYATSLSNRLH